MPPGGFQSTTLGVAIRYITSRRVLQYPEEVEIPAYYRRSTDEKNREGSERQSEDAIVHESTPTSDSDQLERGDSDDSQATATASREDAAFPSDKDGRSASAEEQHGESNDPTAIEQETTFYAGEGEQEDQGANPAEGGPVNNEHGDEEAAVEDTGAAVYANGEGATWASDETVVDERSMADATSADARRGNDTYDPDKVHTADPNLVGWYSADDPECPYNWPTSYKCFVACQMSILTFAVYVGSSIYTAGVSGPNSVMEEFDVSLTTALVGLTVFILGYGVSPMVWSPLSEIPRIGRMPIYVGTLAMFVVLQIPAIYAPNIQTLLAMRFWAGWCGPAIAIGGATMGDMFRPKQLAYALGVWSCGAVCGPHFGPLLGGFAFQANGWTWPLWVLTWLSGGALILIACCFPETSWKTILYRRTMRLRGLTGNNELKCQAMKAAEQKTGSSMTQEYLVRPIVLCREPTVLIYNIYLALIYGLLNIWFESFPMVFRDLRGFNPGQTGLAFLGLFVGAWSSCAAFCIYFYYRLSPVFDRNEGIMPVPESRLRPAPIAAFCVPIAMFGFGWTGQNTEIHWIVPIIFTSFFGIGSFILFQTIFSYLSDTYPKELASVFTINDLFRSSFGAAFPLFAHALFLRLGIGGGNSLLGGLACLFIPAPFLFLRYGHRIRAASKYAAKTGL